MTQAEAISEARLDHANGERQYRIRGGPEYLVPRGNRPGKWIKVDESTRWWVEIYDREYRRLGEVTQ